MHDYLKSLPHAFLGHGDKTHTVTITAGLDGDEYASIDAAYRLIDILGHLTVNGRINIFPIVNLEGFKNVSSINPVDKKYPKYIYPGKRNGSETEKLIYFLNKNYISQGTVWIDLHGGGITECLDPYVYAFETNNSDNKTTLEVTQKLNFQKAFLGKPGEFNGMEYMAKQGLSYFIIEAGFGGRRNDEFVSTHIEAVKNILQIIGVLPKQRSLPSIPKRVYRKMYEYAPDESGLWFPQIDEKLFVRKDQLIGEIRSYDNKKFEVVRSPYDGEILWITKGMVCQANEYLFGIGYEEAKFEKL